MAAAAAVVVLVVGGREDCRVEVRGIGGPGRFRGLIELRDVGPVIRRKRGLWFGCCGLRGGGTLCSSFRDGGRRRRGLLVGVREVGMVIFLRQRVWGLVTIVTTVLGRERIGGEGMSSAPFFLHPSILLDIRRHGMDRFLLTLPRSSFLLLRFDCRHSLLLFPLLLRINQPIIKPPIKLDKLKPPSPTPPTPSHTPSKHTEPSHPPPPHSQTPQTPSPPHPQQTPAPHKPVSARNPASTSIIPDAITKAFLAVATKIRIPTLVRRDIQRVRGDEDGGVEVGTVSLKKAVILAPGWPVEAWGPLDAGEGVEEEFPGERLDGVGEKGWLGWLEVAEGTGDPRCGSRRLDGRVVLRDRGCGSRSLFDLSGRLWSVSSSVSNGRLDLLAIRHQLSLSPR
ncbi:hypothetical protein KC338_g11 [Hortaea werneckii]|nr:hypothetical protein KC338_g11 [Hortaea werneckii]